VSTEPEIVARSLADAKRELPKLDEDDAVVSIGSPNTTVPDGFEPSNPLHLRLQFDDVTSEMPTFGRDQVRPPRRDHIQQLIDRGEEFLEAGLVYCHCAAGISRSTAAAFILHCLHRDPGAEEEAMQAVLEDNPFASPNRLMVELADDLLDRAGAMLAAVETIQREM
jgi:predicted protein tyrosine phosphatase